MTEYRDLFTPRPQRRPSIEERFKVWIAAHPKVVETMRSLALQAVVAGKKRIGIAALWERARWELDVVAPESGIRWNNDLRAPMARHLMAIEPRLREVFETREQRRA